MKGRVYVASPMSLQPIEGPRAAALAGDKIVAHGWAAYLPQLDRLWAYMTGEKPYETWLAHDFAWIEVCDALVRCPGESKGADREVEFAKTQCIPIFLGVESFLAAKDLHDPEVEGFVEEEAFQWQPHVGRGCATCGDVKW